MTQPEFMTPLYTSGYGEEVIDLLRGYTAEANAAYLLPYLRPGLRVLDYGCGPGSISVGLAQAVAPGELHGVDQDQAQVELARDFARTTGQDNAVFHVTSLTALPFEDGFFDAVHCHNVLMYIPDTRSALAEVKRVLKPCGIIGCRELICDSCSSYPDAGAIGQAWDVFASMAAFDDGHPQMGKDLKTHILEAGFENVWVGASFDTYSAPAQIAFIHAFATRWFLSPEIVETSVKYGVATPQLWYRIRAAIDAWKTAPDAIAAFAWGEAIANQP